MQKGKRFTLPILVFLGAAIVAAAGLYFWYFVYRPCDADAVAIASAKLIRQRDRYDHSYQFATSASRDEIVRPVAELQQILMDTQEVTVPACLQPAKVELLDYMGTVIHAFLAYGAQEADGMVRDLLDQAQKHYDQFTIDLETVNRCAPFCIP